MNIRHAVASLAVAAIAIGTPLVLMPAANADTPINVPVGLALGAKLDVGNFDVATCVQAHLRVETAGREANSAVDALAKAEANIDVALKANVTNAQKGLTDALNAESAPTPTQAQLDAVTAAEVKLQAALKALDDKTAPSAALDNVKTAKAKLDRAIDEAKSVCDDNGNHGGNGNHDGDHPGGKPTDSPSPTTSMTTPATATVISGPVQLAPPATTNTTTVLPTGAANTGDGSTE